MIRMFYTLVVVAAGLMTQISCADSPKCEPGGATDCAETKADETSGDTSACADERRFGDYKEYDDYCWNPPEKYCAQGAGMAITPACNPEGTLCCEFGSTCIPCGWSTCNNNPTAACQLFPTDLATCQSAAVKPDMDVTICYDGVASGDVGD